MTRKVKLLPSPKRFFRDMAAPLDEVLRLRHETNDGLLVGPHMLVAGPMLVGPVPLKLAGMKLIQAVGNPENGKASVRSLRQAGADFIKVNDSLPANTYLAIVEAAKRERMSALYADLGINAAPAPACATLPVANWIRSNSYSDMSPSRRQNDIMRT